jgi:hypothetical protein
VIQSHSSIGPIFTQLFLFRSCEKRKTPCIIYILTQAENGGHQNAHEAFALVYMYSILCTSFTAHTIWETFQKTILRQTGPRMPSDLQSGGSTSGVAVWSVIWTYLKNRRVQDAICVIEKYILVNRDAKPLDCIRQQGNYSNSPPSTKFSKILIGNLQNGQCQSNAWPMSQNYGMNNSYNNRYEWIWTKFWSII